MFILIWSQVQHGSGSINHVMIAIWSIGLLLISAIPVNPITSYDRKPGFVSHAPLEIVPVQHSPMLSSTYETLLWCA